MTTFPVSENAEWVSVLSYTTALTAPFAIQAALKLNVFEILNRHGQLSAQQIIDLLPRPCTNPHAPALLDRLLHHLSSKSPTFPCPLLTASLSPTSSVILYSLLPPSQYFLKDANGVSVGECVSQQVLHFLDTFRHLDAVILDGGDGFQKEFGHHISHHIAEHTPKLVAAMASMTAVLMPQLLDAYDGFADVGTLVDVGGCTGYTLIHILDKYPDLKGINFDQPQIVTSGAIHPRLTHVGGNMLEAIPQADAVFMMVNI
ncbi:hypothetical protein KP509_32G043900 [Ceratopteris richardii]|uniref:Uncharacterized protein n=1 Tax=Ceratopteris richardii TaxID=49495 RepID=A0A8T2QV08_CERRI|nr:hypothetical protein KP509_32G043900 [Ceratopteris richardii]